MFTPELLARAVPFAIYIGLLAAGPSLAGVVPPAIAPWLYALPLLAVTAARVAYLGAPMAEAHQPFPRV